MAHKYKLQRLLDVRGMIEEEKKVEMGNAVQRLESEKNELIRINEERAIMAKEFGIEAEKGTTVGKLQEIAGYLDYFKKTEKLQKLRIKMAENYLEKCREDLLKASQEKKMIEKLKEIDLEKYIQGEKIKEDKIVDDLVSFKETKKEI